MYASQTHRTDPATPCIQFPALAAPFVVSAPRTAATTVTTITETCAPNLQLAMTTFTCARVRHGAHKRPRITHKTIIKSSTTATNNVQPPLAPSTNTCHTHATTTAEYTRGQRPSSWSPNSELPRALRSKHSNVRKGTHAASSSCSVCSSGDRPQTGALGREQNGHDS